MRKEKYNYTWYGTKAVSSEVEGFLRHVILCNEQAEVDGKRSVPVCIWGRHGIGKTELVEAFAKENGYDFACIAPAQFEEMGDLTGMPQIIKGKTTFAPPDWVPTNHGPGILLIDDVNRADDRILRGIMQLFQNGGLVSWKLPSKWHLVLTANPDGGDYSITPMDDAMITRMMHISMVFDVAEWAKWAEKTGVDHRGINFVLTYPEMVSGERTTARSLVQFFQSLSGVDDLSANLSLIRTLGDACLDAETVSAFISFVQAGLSNLLSPEEILGGNDFLKDVYEPMKELTVKSEGLRVDIISTIISRLVNQIQLQKEDLNGEELNNLIKFARIEFIPDDLRLILTQDLLATGKKNLKKLMNDDKIGELLIRNL